MMIHLWALSVKRWVNLWSPVTNIGGRSLQKGGSICGVSVIVRIG